MVNLKMPLSDIRFEFKEHTLFYSNRMVTQYTQKKEASNEKVMV